jgi:hypothetical protein
MTSTRSEPSRRPWTKAQIRQARQTPLVPVLEAMGYQLMPRKNGNYLLCRLAAEIVIKDHYWINRQDQSTGNAIDFMVQIEGMTFSQAMKHLLASADQSAVS